MADPITRPTSPNPPPPRLLAAVDRWANRLYGPAASPLYQSGALVILLWTVLLVTGLWLIFFYRIGAPWESVAGLTRARWTGNWIRGVHRYASDLAVVATLVHAFRMLLQRRSWGPRALAWIAGVILFGMLLFSGLTGFVMVWDLFGQRLAVEGARLLDVLPIFSEPTIATFLDGRPVPGAFFFLNLFLHVAVPLGLILVLWLHLSRTARPGLLPPRGVTWALIGGLVAMAVLLPVTMAPPADPFTLPASIPIDWFYAPWLPVAARVGPGTGWALVMVATVAFLAVPWLTRPAKPRRPPASHVDSALCTGCRQCALDCPFEAIEMVARSDGRAEVVAKVDPDRCVSCGLCAGSCAPMSVGPPGRTGRDQLAEARRRLGTGAGERRIVVFACEQGAARARPALEALGGAVMPVPCVGNLHTSTVEFAVRRGGAGALILTCPARDCWSREGPKWLDQRLYHDREAELKARVDRRRILVVEAAAYDEAAAVAAFQRLAAALAALETAAVEAEVPVDPTCAASAAGGTP